MKLTFTQYSFRRYFFSSLAIGIGVCCLFYKVFILDHFVEPKRTLWILDTSLSLSVEDIPSTQTGLLMSRLDLARDIIKKGIEDISGEHAIISYARDARVEAPFSSDTKYLKNTATHLTTVGLYGGSDVTSALKLAHMLYSDSSIPLHIIIMSDGGSTSTESFPEVSPFFSFSFIGIGSPLGGKIPLGYDANGNRRYKYYNGEEVVIRYDETLLKNLKDFYGGEITYANSVIPSESFIIQSAPSSRQKGIFLIIATLALFFGYFFHPYVRKN